MAASPGPSVQGTATAWMLVPRNKRFHFSIPSPGGALLTPHLPEAYAHYFDPQATGLPSLLWQQEHQ